MQQYNRIAEHLFSSVSAEDRETIITFFITFSRYEFALKQAEFFSGKEEQKASADWDSFASELESSFNPSRTPSLQEAVAFIEAQPPGTQIVRGGRLGRRNINHEHEPQVKRLLLHIKTIRNNLFHGDKIKLVLTERQTSRNINLIKHSLIILYACLELCVDIPRCSNIPNYFLGEMRYELPEE